jgi:hypothetical protein
VRRCAALLAVLAVGLAGCSGAQPPTANVPSPPKGDALMLTQVVGDLRTGCHPGRLRTRLNLVQGDEHLRHDFRCRVVRDNATGTQNELVGLVSKDHDAALRADRVIVVEKALGVSVQSRSELIWLLGTGLESASCTKAGDASYHREMLAEAASYKSVGRGRRVTVEHQSPIEWTKIEAAYIAGACPDQLGVFFSSLATAGQPAAASAVRHELEGLGTRS